MVVLGFITAIITTAMLIEKVEENDENITINESIENTESYIEDGEELQIDWRDGIKILLTILIILYVEKMLKEIIEKETPFTEKNVKTMGKISGLAIVLAIAAKGVSVVFAFAIVIMTYIFKYGYQLQTESDEIL